MRNNGFLLTYQKIEEEKKKLPVTQQVAKGPQIIFHSRDGKSTVTFTQVDTFPGISSPSLVLTFFESTLIPNSQHVKLQYSFL